MDGDGQLSLGDTATFTISVRNTGPTVSSARLSATSGGVTTQVVEGGATDSYSLVLTHQPAADLVITVLADAQVTVAPSSVVFTTANWDVPQSVTVTAVNDDIAEGAHAATVSHTAASTDANYNGIACKDDLKITAGRITVDLDVVDLILAGLRRVDANGPIQARIPVAGETATNTPTATPTLNTNIPTATTGRSIAGRQTHSRTPA